MQRRQFFFPPQPSSLPPPNSVLRQVLSLPSSNGLTLSLPCSPPHQSQPQLQPVSPLPAPSPYAEQTDSLTERREPDSRPASPLHAVCIGCCVPRPRRPPVPGTHIMAIRPSSIPLRVPLPSLPPSSLPDIPDPESNLARATNPTIPHLLAAVVTNLSLESTVASALDAELVDFAAACRLDYAASLVAESEQEDFECLAATVPHLVAMLLAPEGDPDAPDIPTPRSYAEAITGPNSSQWQMSMDAEMASWKSTSTYIDAVPPSRANIVDGMWIFRVKQPLWRPVYNLRQAPCKWQDTLRSALAALGFAPSSADPSLYLRSDTSLPPFYVLVYVDDLVFATADTEALALVKSFSALASGTPRHSPLLCLPVTSSLLHLRTIATSGMGLVLGGRGPVVLTGHADASWVDDLATQRSSQGYTFSLGSGSVSWQSTSSSSVLSSTCEAEIYAGATAAQELRWLTYLLTDLGERPRSSPILYVDNKAIIALCQEHRLEHRTKHIALQYFLARELQQHGQLCLAYVATRANTADIFTKALLSE
ncbi:unnamed protein product [Closterium sp. NIES-53]